MGGGNNRNMSEVQAPADGASGYVGGPTWKGLRAALSHGETRPHLTRGKELTLPTTT